MASLLSRFLQMFWSHTPTTLAPSLGSSKSLSSPVIPRSFTARLLGDRGMGVVVTNPPDYLSSDSSRYSPIGIVQLWRTLQFHRVVKLDGQNVSFLTLSNVMFYSPALLQSRMPELNYDDYINTGMLFPVELSRFTDALYPKLIEHE
jgi:hypothetical protein